MLEPPAPYMLLNARMATSCMLQNTSKDIQEICHSCGFPHRRPLLRPRSGHVRFEVDKVALVQISSEYFGFSCQFIFPQMLHTHVSSGAGTIGQLVAEVSSELSITLPHETERKQVG
jgi:hypothetical protein